MATPRDPTRVIVRVNATGTAEHAADLAALRQTGYRLVMLPKTESRAQLDAFGGEWQLVALSETVLGIDSAPHVAAAPTVTAVMWGAEDLIASMHGRSSRLPEGRYLDVARHARSAVLLAAASGKAAIDAVCVNIPDLDGLAAEAQDAAASGFALKACIHPSQVPVVRTAFHADQTQVAWARRYWRRPATLTPSTAARSRSTGR
jgi:citrate lyase subunit beta/citryl-CoA lyase